MGGLVFVVVIWPVGILACILLLVLGGIGIRKLRSGAPGSEFASALRMVSILVAVGYTIGVLSCTSLNDAAVLVVTIVPVLALAIGCIVLAGKLRASAARGA